jgi:O-antigen/teichoic acid export membrane protein
MTTAKPAIPDISIGFTHAQTERVLRDAGWNLAGSVLPLFAAVVAIPVLINTLGTDRFGLVTLAWAGVGYFSLLDFGVGRALTKCVAESLAKRDHARIPQLFWSSLWLLGIGSAIGSGLLCLIPMSLINQILKVPQHLALETRYSLWILAATVPLVTLSATLRGFLEAHRWFKSINVIRVILGLATFTFPVLIVRFSPTLPAVLGSLALARMGACLAYLILCFKATPETRNARWISWHEVRPVLSFGGWITLTNTISPLMTYLDRFFVSALLSLSAVSYYTTPYELTSKIQILPAAIATSLFPAFASLAGRNCLHLTKLYNDAIAIVFHCVYPVSILLVLFAQDGLRLWLGADFALKSYGVVQINAIGLLLNSLAQIPSTFSQASGRPDVNAKFHLCELPIYLVCAYFLTHRFGIVGAALAGSIRITIDAALLFLYVHSRKVPLHKTVLISAGLVTAVAAAVVANTLGPVPRLAIGLIAVLISGLSLVRMIGRKEGSTIPSFATS